jgi:hypothetical protein
MNKEKAYDKYMKNDKEGTCCLCNAHYDNYGHNASPVKDGRCCDKCQEEKVLPARGEKHIPYHGVSMSESAIARLLREHGADYLPNVALSKQYLKVSEQTYRKLQKKIPTLWSAMMTRRYLLPKYRQSDYYNQEACDYLMLDFLAEFTQARLSRATDEVLNTQYVSIVRSLECGRPTLFLEKEFAAVLEKSPLPDDYEIDDIKWRWPSFRVYLPKGYLTIKRHGQKCSMMFIDIVKVDKDVDYELPSTMVKEIHGLFRDYRIPPFRNAYSGMGVSGNLDFDCVESAIAYAGTAPIDATTVFKIMSIVSGTPLKTSLTSDELDNEFTARMLKIALKILLFLSSYEIIPDPPDAGLIRKPSMDGDRQITGLYHAKFVGQSAIRLTESGAKDKGMMVSSVNGRTVAPHWVSGHWQRICHGPKHSLRKLVWIGIYRTGKANEE